MSSEYPDSFKEAMVQKMSGPAAKSACGLSVESGVPQSTLSRWLREYGRMQSTGGAVSSKKRPQNWPAEQKLSVVQEYDALGDEESRGRFLRERGLYNVEIDRWRQEMLEALNERPKRKDPKDQRIRELERELRRKEKALAETAALLTLKKTAQEVWGDSEDEK
jgi:transposase-like protein